MTKRTYEAPRLRKQGSMTDLTQQNRRGTFIDASFNAGTPLSQITLS